MLPTPPEPAAPDPEDADLAAFLAERTRLRFVLVNGRTVDGVLRWVGPHSLRVVRPDRSELVLRRATIALYGPAGHLPDFAPDGS